MTGENITQTLQFVDSGNAELGFVALSQVIGKGGSQWLPPADLYPAIMQDAVLLKTGEANPAAAAFLDFLKSDEAVGDHRGGRLRRLRLTPCSSLTGSRSRSS